MKHRNQNRPSLCFQAACHRRQLNLALVFVFFCCTFLLIGECVLLLCFGFIFPYQAKRLAWGTSPKWPILCWVVHKTLTSNSISGLLLQMLTFWNNWISFSKERCCYCRQTAVSEIWRDSAHVCQPGTLSTGPQSILDFWFLELLKLCNYIRCVLFVLFRYFFV